MPPALKINLSSFRENTLLGLQTLVGHKFRSFLTILGVFIGTLVVILVSSIFVGLHEQVSATLQGFGNDTLFIQKEPFVQMGPDDPQIRKRKDLTYEDATAIKEYCPSIQYSSPESYTPSQARQVKYKGIESQNTRYHGCLPDFQFVSNIIIRQGRFFTESEEEHSVPVAVIGYDVYMALFPSQDPIGKEVEYDQHIYRVVGVAEKTKRFIGDDSQDNIMYAPWSVYRKYYPNSRGMSISAKAYPGKVSKAIDEVTELLRRRRKVPFYKDNDFEVGTANSVQETFNQLTGGVFVVMVAISSIALMVGGIGVMNIMLMAVTERTKEIGIRKAIGARRRDIIWQFLIEAMTLTGTGGGLAILTGLLFVLILNVAAPDFPAAVPLWSVLAGLSCSVGIGLVFGLWPAAKAARLDPVEALRHE